MSTGDDAPAGPDDLLTFDEGRLVVDTARKLAIVEGRNILLGACEYRLLERLARNAGRVLSHAALLDALVEDAYTPTRGNLKTHMWLLRLSIGAHCIVNRRGLGYYLAK